MTAGGEPFVVGLSELVLIVADVPRAADFYRTVVGLVPETEPNDEWAWFRVGGAATPQRIAVHRGPLLHEEHSPHPAGRRFGPAHFALEVPMHRLEAAVAQVRAAGIAVHGPTELAWMNAVSWYFFDPDGHLVEFWSPRRA